MAVGQAEGECSRAEETSGTGKTVIGPWMAAINKVHERQGLELVCIARPLGSPAAEKPSEYRRTFQPHRYSCTSLWSSILAVGLNHHSTLCEQ